VTRPISQNWCQKWDSRIRELRRDQGETTRNSRLGKRKLKISRSKSEKDEKYAPEIIKDDD
jgi:hypothetical protein